LGCGRVGLRSVALAWKEEYVAQSRLGIKPIQGQEKRRLVREYFWMEVAFARMIEK
jgi:hypothetical protein